MKAELKIPKHKNEDQEREFWSKVDLSQHFERENFKNASFPNLKPTSRSIAIRIPEYLFLRLKEKAHELCVPYQTLMKQFIAKGLVSK